MMNKINNRNKEKDNKNISFIAKENNDYIVTMIQEYDYSIYITITLLVLLIVVYTYIIYELVYIPVPSIVFNRLHLKELSQQISQLISQRNTFLINSIKQNNATPNLIIPIYNNYQTLNHVLSNISWMTIPKHIMTYFKS